MPAAAPFAPIIGSGIGVLGGLLGNRKSADEQRVDRGNAAAAQAQTAEVQRQTELAKFLEEIFMGQYSNAAPTDPSLFAGNEQMRNLLSANSPGFQEQTALKGLMGLTGNPGTGLAQGLGQQSFLNDQQSSQDLLGSAEALAKSVLAKYGQQGGENTGIAPVPAPGQTNAAGQPVDVTPQGPVLGTF